MILSYNLNIYVISDCDFFFFGSSDYFPLHFIQGALWDFVEIQITENDVSKTLH